MSSTPEFSHWRVWIIDGEVRVARDWLNAPCPPGPQLQPQHLEDVDGLIVWRPHRQGAEIPSISLNGFVAWLDQGGAG